MAMKIIDRERWIIRRKDTEEIMCGLSKNFQFKQPDLIGDTSIKTYKSESKALAAFEKRFYMHEFEVEALKVRESLEIL